MEVDGNYIVSDEEYFINDAKSLAATDLAAAKSLMLTAKTLFPNCFKIFFESYLIEKKEKNVKNAANCFGEMLLKFSQEPELINEINKITNTIRSKSNEFDVELKFLSEMFSYLPDRIQNQLLFFRAEHCEDTMEHCKMLLILLQKFPQNIPQYCLKLIDALLTADKYSDSNNAYRQLLICDLIPLLIKHSEYPIELNAKLLYRLLNKSIEYYVLECNNCRAGTIEIIDNDKAKDKMEYFWRDLFVILEFVGKKLAWDSDIISFKENWSKQNYWQKVQHFFEKHQYFKSLIIDENKIKQAVYSLIIFSLYCFDEYYTSLNIKSNDTVTKLLLTHSFFDNVPKPTNLNELKNITTITVFSNNKNFQNVINNFFMSFNYWSLLHSSEIIHKEFQIICSSLKIDSIFVDFKLDYLFYVNNFEELIKQINILNASNAEIDLSKRIRLLVVCYLSKIISSHTFLEYIVAIIKLLPSHNIVPNYEHLTISENKRVLLFLPLAKNTILQYCVRLIVDSLKLKLQESPHFEDLIIGHLMVLVQVDWPQQEHLLTILLERIQKKKRFQYHLFFKYVINVDIMEEVLYLMADHGGGGVFELAEPASTTIVASTAAQRRIMAKNAEKTARDELKSNVQKQMLRCTESVDNLIIQFLINEEVNLLKCLV